MTRAMRAPSTHATALAPTSLTRQTSLMDATPGWDEHVSRMTLYTSLGGRTCIHIAGYKPGIVTYARDTLRIHAWHTAQHDDVWDEDGMTDEEMHAFWNPHPEWKKRGKHRREWRMSMR